MELVDEGEGLFFGEEGESGEAVFLGDVVGGREVERCHQDSSY